MNIRFFSIAFLLNLLVVHTGFSQTGVTKKDYLKLIKETEEKIWQTFEAVSESCEKNPSQNTESCPKPQLYWGRLEGLLYVVTGEKKYAERARKILLESSIFYSYYGIRVLRQIEKSGLIGEADLKVINQKILDDAERALQYWVEWGAHNLCTNHIVNPLTAVMQYFPQHPDFPRWKQKRDINVSSSWGRWSIEDSQIYIPPWLMPMMQYAELAGREEEFYAMPMTKYYFDYFVQLMTPEGEIVEFGDSGPSGDYGWPRYIAVLEKGARVYRDGRMKWAAHRLFQSNVFEKEQVNIFTVNDLVDAFFWADDSIPEEVPTDKSRLVLEDHVGKKVVFRSGWDPKATYLFLNFLEDVPFGIDGKEHLINTIPVETEKNHHGHADENAICLLMKDGSVLLHDSGYRETATTGPDGQYRADTYHNKLIVRSGLADPQMRLLPFLLDGGRYRFVKTKLIHFRRFKEVDISRTRLTDKERGYQWDRCINYLKGREWYVVFDIVKILKEGAYTLANLFYTQDIVDLDEKDRTWYDTQYRTLSRIVHSSNRYYWTFFMEFARQFPADFVKFYQFNNPHQENTRLLIYFPEGVSFRRGVEQIRRCYQTERAVYTAKADSLKAGDILVFTTFLIPHSRETDPKTIASSLSDMTIYRTERGYGIKIPAEDGYIQVNAMLDLEAEYLEENVRPRYNFESGKAEYGDLVTDARYCYFNKQGNKLFYSFFKASKLIFEGKPIFEAQGEVMGQDDGSYRKWGIPKWVAWEDEVSLKNR